jgi:hypothetical protein
LLENSSTPFFTFDLFELGRNETISIRTRLQRNMTLNQGHLLSAPIKAADVGTYSATENCTLLAQI